MHYGIYIGTAAKLWLLLLPLKLVWEWLTSTLLLLYYSLDLRFKLMISDLLVIWLLSLQVSFSSTSTSISLSHFPLFIVSEYYNYLWLQIPFSPVFSKYIYTELVSAILQQQSDTLLLHCLQVDLKWSSFWKLCRVPKLVILLRFGM